MAAEWHNCKLMKGVDKKGRTMSLELVVVSQQNFDVHNFVEGPKCLTIYKSYLQRSARSKNKSFRI